LTVSSQDNVTLKLFVEDNIGRKDTVIFGINNSSTVGIDPAFGENNIFGSLYDSLEMRIIQRDSVNHNCLRESHFQYPAAPNLYFPNNVDLKVDFRPYEFRTIYSNFEILIKGFEYPVIVKADFSGISDSYLEGWSAIHLLNSNCDAYDTKSIDHYTLSDTLFLLPDNSFTTLVVFFDHEVGMKPYESIQPTWEIYPNPANRTLTLYGLEQSTGLIEIINIIGQRLYSFKLSRSTKLNFNIENIPMGIYFVRYFDPIEKSTSIRKLIKQ
jgi:hypothetical protein